MKFPNHIRKYVKIDSRSYSMQSYYIIEKLLSG